MPGFWKRQFQPPASPAQIAFDLILGIIAPIACVFLDPIVFVSGGMGGIGDLYRYRFFAYAEIALGVLALSYFLTARRPSVWLAGCLFAGALFSFCLGVLIAPLAVIGLFILIGALGFTPLFSAFVFSRNAIRCSKMLASTGNNSKALIFLAAVLVLAIPLAAQLGATRVTETAVRAVVSGSDEQAEQAIKTLRTLRFLANTDELVSSYQMEKDPKQRERLRVAFHSITGKSIEDRAAELAD